MLFFTLKWIIINQWHYHRWTFFHITLEWGLTKINWLIVEVWLPFHFLQTNKRNPMTKKGPTISFVLYPCSTWHDYMKSSMIIWDTIQYSSVHYILFPKAEKLCHRRFFFNKWILESYILGPNLKIQNELKKIAYDI